MIYNTGNKDILEEYITWPSCKAILMLIKIMFFTEKQTQPSLHLKLNGSEPEMIAEAIFGSILYLICLSPCISTWTSMLSKT